MRSKLKSLLVLALTCAAMTACTTEHIEIPADELYAREFIKKFGVIDPSHNCNMATGGTVTVITSKPTDLKVFANINGKRYIFADYRKVNGTQDITFDIPRNVTEVIVRADNKDHTIPLNSTLNLTESKSRKINENREGSPVAYWSGNKRNIGVPIYASFVWYMQNQNPDNYKNAICDFSFISEAGKEITIYPVGAKNELKNAISDKSYFSHCLGIYWLNPEDDGKIYAENMVDLYYGYSGDLSHTAINDDGSMLEMDRPFNFIINKGESRDALCDRLKIFTLNTRSITYKFNEDGIQYGFYVKFKTITNEKYSNFLVPPTGETTPVKFDYLRFSQAYLNEICENKFVTTLYKGEDGKLNGGTEQSPGKQRSVIKNSPWQNVDSKYSHVGAAFKPISYDTGETRLFFSFESGNQMNEFDLNDIVFMFDESTTPIVYDEIAQTRVDLPGQQVKPEPEPEYEQYEWLIAAEDLGGTNDFDFNDLVLSVKYKTLKDGAEPEYTDVTITPLAAGGTLPIYLMYDGLIGTGVTPSTYVIGDECHHWLGGDGTSTPLNVHGSITHTCAENKKVTLRVPGRFSLTSHGNNAAWSSENMGGFWLLVDPKGQFDEASHPHAIARNIPASTRKVQPPKQGTTFTAPQMICVGTEWEWTTEGSPINETYLHFTAWLNSTSDNPVEWYGSTSHHNGNVVPRPH